MAGSPGAKIVGRLALKVLPDTSEFVPKLKAFTERVERQLKVEIPVTLDRTEALAEMRALRAALEVQAAKDIDIDVGIDSKGAIASLTALKGIQGALPSIGHGTGQVGQLLGRWGAILAVVSALVITLGPSLAILVPLAFGLVGAAGAVWAGWDRVKKLFGELKPQLAALKQAVGAELVKGLQPVISALGSKFFPVLQSGMAKLAGVLNLAFRSLGNWLTSAQGVDRVGKAFDAVAMAMQPFGQLLTPLTRLFVELSIAAAPALKLIGDNLVILTENFANWLERGNGTKAITDAVKDIGKFIVIIARGAKQAFPAMSAGFKVLLPILDGVVIGFGLLMSIVKPVFDFMGKHQTTMQILGASLVLIAAAFGAVALVGALFASTIALVVSVVIGLILAFAALGPKIKAAWNAVVAATVVAWNAVKAAVVGAVATVFAKVAFTWRAILVTTKALWTVISNAVKAGWSKIKSIVVGAAAEVTGRIASAWNKVKSVTSAAWNAAVGFVKDGWNKIKSAVTTGVSKVVSVVQQLPGKIKSILTFDLSSAGRKLIESFARGIMSALNKAYDAAKAVADKIKALVPGSPVKAGPLRSFNRGAAGIKLMEMLADGIRKGGLGVESALSSTLARASERSVLAPVFNPTAVNGVASQMSAQVGAIVDNTTTTGPQEVIINWETGRGVMRQIADTALAAREFTAKQAAVLGAES